MTGSSTEDGKSSENLSPDDDEDDWSAEG